MNKLHLVRRSTTAVAIALVVTASVSNLGSASAQTANNQSAVVHSARAWPSAIVSSARWSVEPGPDTVRIVWHGAQRLVVGTARLELRDGVALVGYAREVGSDAVLVVERSTTPISNVQALSLWRSGVRIDGSNGQILRRSSGVPDVQQPSVPRSKPATAIDPGVRGPYATRRLTYNLDGLVWPEYPAPIETIGEVTAPIGASGPLPLVILLHGRHSTCFIDGPNGSVTADWPCAPGWTPIPSHEGYRAIADLLASQGRLVVSIAANGVNAQDYLSDDGGASARSQLVRHHLRLWRQWNASSSDPWGGTFEGKVDLQRVVLVGHSRGGEGVVRAAIDSNPDDPWRIQGLVPIGPTAFGQQIATNVHTVVLLPYCDGDVSDLQGQLYIDGARDLVERDPALHAAVMVLGANHNFFNAEWTPGLSQAPSNDDFAFEDTVCRPSGPLRLSPVAQQTVGASYTAALVRLVQDRDATMRQFIDEGRAIPSAGGAATLTAALGSDRMSLYTAAMNGRLVTQGRVQADRCRAYAFPPEGSCQERHELYGPRVPHWLPPYPGLQRPAPSALAIEWDGAGWVQLGARTKVDLRDRTRVEVRVALDPSVRSARFVLRVTDRSGKRVELAADQMTALPGRTYISAIWAQTLRFSLSGLRGIDLANVGSIELGVRDGAGRAFVLDASAVGARATELRSSFAPRVDLPIVKVPEGDVPGAVYVMRIPIRGAVVTTGQVYVEVQGMNSPPQSFVLDVLAGATEVTVPVHYDGDTEFIGDSFTYVLAYGVRNVEIGNYIGRVTFTEDDPAPIVSVDHADVTGNEKSGLTWTFHLSKGAPPRTALRVDFLAPTSGVEIDSADVSSETWYRWTFTERPSPPVPPSSVGAAEYIFLDEGMTSFTLHVPLRSDGVREGQEMVVLQLTDFVGGTLSLTGGVRDGDR